MLQPLARLCVGSDCSIGRITICPATASRGHRRWQTMHNRWWSEAQPAGNGYLTIIRRRRCRTNLSVKRTSVEDVTPSHTEASHASHDMAGGRDNLSLTAQICTKNHNNLNNLCEPITNLCGIREFRERLHCKMLISSDINRASGYNMNNPILPP